MTIPDGISQRIRKFRESFIEHLELAGLTYKDACTAIGVLTERGVLCAGPIVEMEREKCAALQARLDRIAEILAKLRVSNFTIRELAEAERLARGEKP